MTPLALEFDGVAHDYRTADGPLRVLADVDLEVRQHEFVAVLGPSGCGKSTLLRLVAGLMPPAAGTLNLLVGGVLATGEGRGVGVDDTAYSAGVGLSWTAQKNVRLGLRWSAEGFEDADLDPEGTWRRGLRAGVEFKFDEEALRWMQP